jgi:phenylacetic acid degradation protein
MPSGLNGAMGVYEIDGVIPVVHPTAFVHPEASLIGDVVVGPDCYIGPFASLRGDFGRVDVARGSNVQDSAVLHCFPDASCVVEEEGHIGHAAVLHGCTVRTHALVGINAVVMDGAVIGEDALVAANSFVQAGFEVPARTLVAGNPAKVVRELDDTAVRWKANGPRAYQALTRRSLATFRPVEPLPELDPDRPRLRHDAERSVPLHELRARAGGDS